MEKTAFALPVLSKIALSKLVLASLILVSSCKRSNNAQIEGALPSADSVGQSISIDLGIDTDSSPPEDTTGVSSESTPQLGGTSANIDVAPSTITNSGQQLAGSNTSPATSQSNERVYEWGNKSRYRIVDPDPEPKNGITTYRYATDPKTTQKWDPDGITTTTFLKDGIPDTRTNQPILITGVYILATNLPKTDLSADQCLFAATMGGVDPRSTELFCKYSSTKNRGAFRLAEEFPVGIYIPANTRIGCALGVNSHGNKWSPSVLSEAFVSCRIKYKPFQPGMSFGQMLRIPYLDSAKLGENLISEGAWYKSTATTPMRIRGIQSFYGIFDDKRLVDNRVEAQTCLIRKNREGEIVGEKVCSKKVVLDRNEDTFDPPGFTPLNIGLGEGSLHAECTSSTKTAGDCAIYVLIQRDAGTPAPKSASTIYHKHPFSNSRFLYEHYCEYHLKSSEHNLIKGEDLSGNPQFGKLTPAGVHVLDDVLTTPPPCASAPASEECKLARENTPCKLFPTGAACALSRKAACKRLGVRDI